MSSQDPDKPQGSEDRESPNRWQVTEVARQSSMDENAGKARSEADLPSSAKLGSRWWQQLMFLVILVLGVFYLIGLTQTSNPIGSTSARQLERYGRGAVANPVARIDQALEDSWQQAGIEPNPTASIDLQMRRLCLALTGMQPSLEQLRWAEAVPESERLDHFLVHLLNDRASHDYLAERITRSWVGTENGAFVVFRRRRLVDWLAEELGRNRPYDQLVSSVLTSRGLWTDNEPVNFMTGHFVPEENRLDQVRVTGRVSRCFLGMRLDCLQCHDDFTGTTEVGDPDDPREGLQTDFHGLASFFGQVTVSPTGIHDDRDHAPYEVALLGETEPSPLLPAVPYGQDWLPDPGTNRQPDRQRFAQWLTHPDNRPFARSMVNRVWGLLFGKPMVQPIDDLPLYGPFPPGMELLTDDFIQHDYDLRRLISVMVHSTAFQRDSRGNGVVTPQHEDLWASFPLTRIRPEQMAGIIHQSASLSRLDDASHVLVQLVRYGEQGEFLRRFGDLGGEEFTRSGETVTQRLLLFNGSMISERLGSEGLPLNSVVEIQRQSPDDETVIRTVYRVVLTREPTERELAHYLPMVQENRKQAIEDMFWVLVNSSESLVNH